MGILINSLGIKTGGVYAYARANNSGVLQWEAPEAKILATYQNSWVTWGTSFNAAAYWELNGIVYFEGLVKGGTLGSPIFTLPVGKRPALRVMLRPTVNSAANDGARLDVYTDGTVRTSGVTSNSYLSLEGLSFRVG